MITIILAGGLGTRLSEETSLKPKPMVEIGGMPIIWHIMKHYYSYGFKEFIICCGYRGYQIKEFFANYLMHKSDVIIEPKKKEIKFTSTRTESWKISCIDTGQNTMTGGRLLRVKQYIEKDENFCMTYGDGLSNINLSKLLEFHKTHGKLATLTASLPTGKFGALELDGTKVKNFLEKPRGDGNYINGGFFILSKDTLNLIDGDHTVFEAEPLTSLSLKNELRAFKHDGFWQPMDTLRDKINLENLWNKNKAPWKNWND